MQSSLLKVQIVAGLILMLAGCAGVNQATLTRNPLASPPTLGTEKNLYRVGEKIKVNFANSTGDDADWICIVSADSPDTDGGNYQYLPKGLGHGSMTFDPPSPGKYEARAFYNYRQKGYVVAVRHPFLVADNQAAGIAGTGAQAVKATRDDYVLFQSVIFGEKNKPPAAVSTSGSLGVLKTPNGNMVDYDMWAQRNNSPTRNKDNGQPVFRHVRFSRNPATEEVYFSDNTFGLAEEVVNQILRQVEKNPRTEGTWDQEISLRLLGSHLPRKLGFHFNVQKVQLQPGVQGLLIRTYADPFTVDVLPTATQANNGYFSGIYKVALVYSPEEHRLYQTASEFEARKGDEMLQLQEIAYLAGSDGKPVYPLLDMRTVLDLKKPDQAIGGTITSLPRWVAQAFKVQQVVSLASATTAERASNPGVLTWAAQALEIDGWAGTFGLPSSSSLIETYAESQGGQGAKLAAKLFTNVGSSALGEMLPETWLAVNVPALGVAATALGGYAMWEITAELSGMWLAGEIGKLTPFEWPKCAPMDCIAQADKAYELEPRMVEAEPGPPPEPPAAPRAWWKSPVAPLTVLGVSAGVALGLAGGGAGGESAGGGSSGSSCAASPPCCSTNGGIQTTGVIVPTSCASCPSGTTQVGTDTVTSGGPYRICDCNGC